MKLLKIILALVVIIPVVVIAALVFGPSYVNWNNHKDLFAQLVQDKSGLDVTFGGDLTFEVFPQLRFTSDDITVAAFQGDKSLLSVKNVAVELSLKDLLKGGLALEKLHLNDLEVFLHQDIKGRANWEPKRVKRVSSSSVPDLSFLTSVGDVVLSNVNVVYEDDVTGQQFTLQEANLSVKAHSLNDAELSVEGRVNGAPLVVDMKTNLSNLRRAPVDATITLGGSTIVVVGQLYDVFGAFEYDGTLTAKGNDLLEQLYTIINLPPQKRIVNDAVDLSSRVSYSAVESSVSDLNLVLGTGADAFSVSGQFKAETPRKGVPKFEGDLDVSSKLNLDKLGVCTATTAGESKGDAEWSSTPIDVSAIHGQDMDISLRLSNGFVCSGYDFKSFASRVTIQDKRLSLKELKAEFQEGVARASFDMNTRVAPYAGSVNVGFDAFPVTKFMSDAVQKRAVLPLDGEAALQFTGVSVADFVSSLKGDINFKSEGAKVSRVNTANFETFVTTLVLGGGAKKDTDVNLNMVAAVENGLLRTSDVSAIGSGFDMVVDGKVDLSRKAVNMRVTAIEESGKAAPVPMIVQGKFSSLKVAPDVVSAGKNVLKEKIGGEAGAIFGDVIDSVFGDELPKNERLQEDTEGEGGELRNNLLKILRGE